ncbi:NIPSNAP family protein [Dyadobacter chenwenxiniae]|uniref:NIPSNAP family protein n=1 Tax=Dyadobacter chenwenxiniae TaxID=2906456 RepID=A0A9X1TIF3_9BACT|nr:NIPSNAP family protein [Dyadobacter chenwenxiniae]MCF0065469.1 NIPSNAP family protein [Dyadobacter chenwenxiniae]UON82123.1 NIPSNAP family protein [Dyadobacter chenwenxiniae]
MSQRFKIQTLLLLFLTVAFAAVAAPPKREFYEIKIYQVKTADQATRVENYLKDAYIPAMHRAGIKNVGVFKPVASDTAAAGKLIYVFTPLKSLEQLLDMPKTLAKDAAYASAGKDYIDAEYKNAPYARYETIVLQAFTGMPMHKKPALTGPKSERVYELRSYEGHTEKIYQNKVKMFNDGGEVPLFERLGFNAVFYAEVIAGSHQPNLMYMTTFENKASRDEHWKAFSADAEWNKLKVNPEYQNNVSKNTSFFLTPTDYSDI